MVFGMNKKERRVPDLSRYDYYYQNKDDFNKSPQLSAAAAYAASTGSYNPAPQRTQSYRSQSLTHHPSHPVTKIRTANRISSVPRPSKSGQNNSYRSYSLRSQGSAQPRKNSMTSNHSSMRQPVVNNSSSRANSITVKTTEVRDPQGRTQSITRRTVRRANGYEYVETTTTTTKAVPIVDPEKHFDEFSGNYILQDDGIEELSEEEHGTHEYHAGHAYAALLNSGSDGEVPLDQTSSISQFSDALEYVPTQQSRKGNQPAGGIGVHKKAGTRHQRHSHPQQQPQQLKPQKKHLSEKEMYAKALAIAQQNVYKTDDSSRTSAGQEHQSRMGQRTLRTPANVAGGNGPSSNHEPAVKQTKNSKKISSFFQRNGNNHNTEPRNSAPVVPIAAVAATTSNVPKSSLPKSPAQVKSKKGMSNEEMYAQALAIAQEKYNQTHNSISPKHASSSNNSATVISNSTSILNERHATATQENKIADQENKLDYQEVKIADQESENATNEVSSPESLKAAIPPVDSRNDFKVTETRPEQIIETEITHIERHEDVVPEDTREEGIAKNVSDAEEQDSDMFERHEGTTATKTTTPEAMAVDANQESEWDRYEKARQDSETNSTSHEKKSKFKNMFDKMKQFSVENSGYQPNKKPRGDKKKAADAGPAPESSALSEVNIVQVAPVNRSNSTSSRGASTTKNVEDSLDHASRHFNDQASDSSFHRSITTKKHSDTNDQVRQASKLTPALQEQVQRTAATTTATTQISSTTGKKPKKNTFFKKLFKRS